MLRRFMVSFSRFMYGRNGADRMNRGLCGLYLALWVIETLVGILTDWYTVYFIIRYVMLGLFMYILFRFLSRNIESRRRENEKYCRFIDRLFAKKRNSYSGSYGGRGYGANGGQRVYSTPEKPIRDRKNYKYVKCKGCGATLRLKRRRGSHTATCPRCRAEVKVRSLF